MKTITIEKAKQIASTYIKSGTFKEKDLDTVTNLIKELSDCMAMKEEQSCNH